MKLLVVVLVLMGCVSAALSLPAGKVTRTGPRMNPSGVRVGQSVVRAGPRTSFSRTKLNPTAARANPSSTIGRPSLARASPSLTRPTPSLARGSPSLARGSPSLAKSSPSLARGSPSLAKSSPSLARGSPSLAKSSPSLPRTTPTAAKVRPTPTVMSLSSKVARVGSTGIKSTPQDTDRRSRSPQHYSTHFQVIDHNPIINFNDFPVAGYHEDGFLGGRGGRFDHSGSGFDHSDRPGFHSDLNNMIPAETLDEFTPPDTPTKEGRHRKYFGNAVFEVPPHAHAIVNDEPFFDTFDHAKAVLSLQKRRKHAHLPTHLLKSLRPYFPFFSESFILH